MFLLQIKSSQKISQEKKRGSTANKSESIWFPATWEKWMDWGLPCALCNQRVRWKSILNYLNFNCFGKRPGVPQWEVVKLAGMERHLSATPRLSHWGFDFCGDVYFKKMHLGIWILHFEMDAPRQGSVLTVSQFHHTRLEILRTIKL